MIANKSASHRTLKSDLARVDAPRRQCQGVSRTPATDLGHACTREGEERRSSTFFKPPKAHFASASCRCHRPLEGDGAWLANAHG